MELYTQEIHIAWVKIYSRMLKTIVPVAISLELQPGLSSDERNERLTYLSNHGSFISTSKCPVSTMDFQDGNTCPHSMNAISPDDEDDEKELISEKIRRAEPVSTIRQ